MMHIHSFHGQMVNRVKMLLFLELIIDELEDATITVETKYYINFARSERKFCLVLP